MIKILSITFSLLNSSHKRKIYSLFFLIFFGLILEMIGLGLILPVVTLLTNKEYLFDNNYFLNFYSYIGSPEYKTLVFFVLLILLLVYILKNIYLFFINWLKYKFAYKIRFDLSNSLFNIYLSQKYSFFINRNSAKLIRNIEEVNIFTDNLNQIIILLTESLLLMLIVAFLIINEPFGTLI